MSAKKITSMVRYSYSLPLTYQTYSPSIVYEVTVEDLVIICDPFAVIREVVEVVFIDGVLVLELVDELSFSDDPPSDIDDSLFGVGVFVGKVDSSTFVIEEFVWIDVVVTSVVTATVDSKPSIVVAFVWILVDDETSGEVGSGGVGFGIVVGSVVITVDVCFAVVVGFGVGIGLVDSMTMI